MSVSTSKRTGIMLAIAGVVLAIAFGSVLIFGGQQSAPNLGSAPSALVLNSTYARSVGYPKTVQAATKGPVTNEKGCTIAIEAVYEDAAGKTGLISDLLKCNSPASAATVLANLRKSIHIDAAIGVPGQLGTSAFATASSAPEYLVAWQVGSGVALSGVDVNIAASSSSSGSSGSTTSKSITRNQVKVLTDAAIRQNSLYH